MKIKRLHDWNITPSEAIRIQRELARQVVTKGHIDEASVRFIAGADIATEGKRGRAAVIVLSYPQLEIVEHIVAEKEITFPYRPGLLAFREIPVLAEAFAKLNTVPDLLIVDGQGIAHFRRFGIACHLGLLLDLPTIGCAKSRLTGTYEGLANDAGSHAALVDGDEIIGQVVRTREKANPLYISVGHRITLDDAVKWVLRLCRGYRLPEPTRLADKLAGGTLDLSAASKEPAEQLSLL